MVMKMSIMAGKSRLVVAAVGIALAGCYAFEASRLRLPAFSDPMGPREVPYLIAAGMCLSCVALVMEHLFKSNRATESGDESRMTSVALMTLCLLLGYYLTFQSLGFILSTALFLLVFLSFTNRGRWRVNIALAILFPIAAYVLLDTLLGARLPAGILQIG